MPLQYAGSRENGVSKSFVGALIKACVEDGVNNVNVILEKVTNEVQISSLDKNVTIVRVSALAGV